MPFLQLSRSLLLLHNVKVTLCTWVLYAKVWVASKKYNFDRNLRYIYKLKSKLSNGGTLLLCFLVTRRCKLLGQSVLFGQNLFFGGNYFDKFKTIGTKSAVTDKFYIHTTFDVEVGKV